MIQRIINVLFCMLLIMTAAALSAGVWAAWDQARACAVAWLFLGAFIGIAVYIRDAR